MEEKLLDMILGIQDSRNTNNKIFDHH